MLWEHGTWNEIVKPVIASLFHSASIWIYIVPHIKFYCSDRTLSEDTYVRCTKCGWMFHSRLDLIFFLISWNALNTVRTHTVTFKYKFFCLLMRLFHFLLSFFHQRFSSVPDSEPLAQYNELYMFHHWKRTWIWKHNRRWLRRWWIRMMKIKKKANRANKSPLNWLLGSMFPLRELY